MNKRVITNIGTIVSGYVSKGFIRGGNSNEPRISC